MKIDLLSYNPLYGFIEFTVNGEKLSDFGNGISDCVMSLNFTRQGNPQNNLCGSKFTIELYDDTAVEIEYRISEAVAGAGSNQGSNCVISYGWSSRGKKITGFTFTGKITQYSLNFDGPSTTLSVEGTIIDNVKVTKIESQEFNSKIYKGLPSDIVRDICEKEGIPIGKIEEAEVIVDKLQDNKPATLLRKGQSASEFINKSFANVKSKETGNTGFKFFIGRDGKAYFVSTSTSNRENASLLQVKEKKTPGNFLDIGSVIKLDENVEKSFGKISNLVSSVNKVMGEFNTIKSNFSGLMNSPSGNSLSNGSGSSSTSSSQGNIVFVGGTIVKNIKDSVPETDKLVYIFKDEANYSWLVDSLDIIKQYCKVGSRIYFLIGERDTYNFNNYLNFYKSISYIEDSFGCQMYVVSVLPVDSNKCDTIYNSNLLNFNIELSKGLFSSNLKFIDLFTYYCRELSKRDTKSNGIDYKTSVNQDVFNRIINYNFVNEDSYYNNLSEKPLRNSLSNVDKTAIAFSCSGEDKCAELASDFISICNGNGDYVKTTKDLINILLPNNQNKKIENYIDATSSLVDIFGKSNESIDYANIKGLIEKLDLPVKDKNCVDLVEKVSSILNNPECIKGIDDTVNFAKDIVSVILPNNSDVEKYANAIKSVSDILSKGNFATNSDYLSFSNNLLELIPTSLGNTSSGYAKFATDIVSVINNGKCDLGNCGSLVNGLVGSICPTTGSEVTKYVKATSDITNLVKGGNISDCASLADSLGTLTGNSKVGNYVKAAQDVWGLFNGGALNNGVNIEDFSMNLGSSLKVENFTKSDLSKNVENTLKGVGSGNLSPSNIGKNVSENLSDLTSGGGIGGSVKNTISQQSDKLDSLEKKLSNIPVKNNKVISASYEYYSGNNKANIVLSFSPTIISTSIGNRGIPGTVESIDAIRNEMIAVTANNDLSKFLGYQSQRNSLIMGMSSSNFDRLNKEVLGLWNKYYSNNIKAELEVLGDVDVDIDTVVKIAVYTKYGFLHHTSGYYHVDSVTDSVSGGSFTTSFSLTKISDKKIGSDGKTGNKNPQDLSYPKVDETGDKLNNEPPDGRYWVRQGPGVALEGCHDRVLNVLEALGKWYYEKNGGRYRLVVTAGTNGSHKSGQYSHANGWKVDVNDWGGPEGNPGGYLVDNSAGQYVEDWRPAFRDYGHSLGLGMAIEGDHIDVQFANGYDWVDGNTYGPVRV